MGRVPAEKYHPCQRSFVERPILYTHDGDMQKLRQAQESTLAPRYRLGLNPSRGKVKAMLYSKRIPTTEGQARATPMTLATISAVSIALLIAVLSTLIVIWAAGSGFNEVVGPGSRRAGRDTMPGAFAARAGGEPGDHDQELRA